MMHAKLRALCETAVYRSIDGTCVANQIVHLRDSRSLRCANTGYLLTADDEYSVRHDHTVNSRLADTLLLQTP